ILEVRREAEPGAWSTETFEYDPNRNQTVAIGPNGQRAEMTYDARGWLTERTVGAGSPSASTELFAYDRQGQLFARIDGRGSAWVSSPDGYGRPMLQLDPLGTEIRISYP